MKRLIVNADDFGLVESVNRAIIASHRDGILTSASLLANGVACHEALALSRALPQLSIGVHLNLSEGSPVSPPDRIPTLVNNAGRLHLTPVQLGLGVLKNQINIEDVHCECRAQILKLFDAGLRPTHVDGHLHVHVLPGVSHIVIALAREFDIRHVRCPSEDLELTLPALWQNGGMTLATLKRSAIAYSVSLLARRFRDQARTAGIACPDVFIGLAYTGFLNVRILESILPSIPNGTTELMCHPGYNSAELESAGGELTRARENEVVALTASEIKKLINDLGICLTSFRDLEDNGSA